MPQTDVTAIKKMISKRMDSLTPKILEISYKIFKNPTRTIRVQGRRSLDLRASRISLLY
jgi:hypothetical protein